MARPKTAESVPMSAPLRERRKREQIDKRDFSGPAGTTRQGYTAGHRERKKARLRQQIVETAVKLFRKRGYEKTRVNDIVQILEISQPTFFRYFPSKDAVLREIGTRGFSCISKQFKSELSCEATTEERLRRLYQSFARTAEADRRFGEAGVLGGGVGPVRSPDLREFQEIRRPHRI